MRTEHHAMAHAHKAARGNSAPKAGDSSKPDGDVNSGAPGGFLSLLAQLDADSGNASTTGAESQTSTVAYGTDRSDSLALGSEQGQGGGDSADPGALLAQLGQGFIRSPDSLAMGKAEMQDADPVARSLRSVHSGLKAGETAEPLLAFKAQDAIDAQSGLATAAAQGKSEMIADAKNAISNVLAHTKNDSSHNLALNAAQDVRSDRFAQVTESAELSQLAAQASRSGSADGTLRQTERTSTKPTSTRVNDNLDGVWGSQALFSGSPLGVAPTTPADALVAPELMVAEQVNYWISQDLQNAELTLDGFDGLPVDVSITLNGNEASVDFRTDQEGIREILHNTESHLKDILAKEGLVLSGVSIGASMQQGDRESAQGRPPESRRRIEIPVIDAPLLGNLKRPSTIAGKSIDVFV
jgi:flagellar hook-length control protein FliK